MGKVLGDKFRVLSLLARGGMGKVYRAEQAPLGRVVALKVLDMNDSHLEGETYRDRFFLEAATSARLTHPNTVRVFDYGTTWDDIYYIAMELLKGRTLQRVIREEAPVDPVRLMRIARQICGSLGEAHSLGLVHRDLKPSNVFLTSHDDDPEFVKVLDFGLVKQLTEDVEMTGEGRLLGSPMYMSPEQVQGMELDGRTDIYSLGIILYMALTGTAPFKRSSSVSVLMSQLSEKPKPVSEVAPDGTCPPLLEWVVMTCLDKDREKRFANTKEVVRALRAAEAEATGAITGGIVLSLEAGKVVGPPVLDDLQTFSSGTRTIPPMEVEDIDATVSGSRTMATAGLVVVPVMLVVILVGLGILLAGGLATVAVGMWSQSRPYETPDVTTDAVDTVEVQPPDDHVLDGTPDEDTDVVEATDAVETPPDPPPVVRDDPPVREKPVVRDRPVVKTRPPVVKDPPKDPPDGESDTDTDAGTDTMRVKEIRDPWEDR